MRGRQWRQAHSPACGPASCTLAACLMWPTHSHPHPPTHQHKSTQHHHQRLHCVKEHLGQLFVHLALVLGEAVKDAAGGGGVEEGERRVQHLQDTK